MEIQLTPETEKAVNAAVRSGGYSTAEEYIYEALQNYYKLKLEQLNAAIADGQGVGTITNDEVSGMMLNSNREPVFLPLILKYNNVTAKGKILLEHE